MSAIPSKRLLVYVAIGLVVLVVGVLGLVSLGGAEGTGEVLLDGGTGTVGSGGAGGLGVSGWGDSLLGVDTIGESTTTTTQVELIWVQVAGAVWLPGVYELESGTRVFQAVVEAGGFTEEADQQAVALAAPLSDGCRVYVPCIGEVPAGTVVQPVVSSEGLSGGGTGGSTSGGPVSLNSATVEQLDTLPGIGPSLAQQIVDYRQSQGLFKSVEQLIEVPGIGPAKLEQIRALVVL